MAISIAVEKFFIWIAGAGAILLLALMGFIFWEIIKKKRAFKEIVETVEVVKKELLPEAKEKLFGIKINKGIIDKVQNINTKELIKKEKSLK